jgi:hypothetical protein
VAENKQDGINGDGVGVTKEQRAADEDNPFETLRKAVEDLRNIVQEISADRTLLAKLEWGNNGSADKNEIYLIGRTDRKCAFQLEVGGKEFLVRVDRPVLKNNKIDTKLTINKGESYSQSDYMAVDNISIPISENDGNSYCLDAQAELRSPNGIQDLDYLTDYWFPKKKLTDDGKCRIELDNQKLAGAELQVKPSFRNYWPKYDRKSNRKSNPWSVSVPELNDSEGWAALFVCVAVRRLIIAIANDPKKYGLSDDDFLKASSLVPNRPINWKHPGSSKNFQIIKPSHWCFHGM